MAASANALQYAGVIGNTVQPFTSYYIRYLRFITSVIYGVRHSHLIICPALVSPNGAADAGVGIGIL